MAPDDNFAFPIGTTFEYLNEGAANIVYRISIPPRTPLPSLLDEYEDGEPLPEDLDLIPYLLGPFEKKLLRVRKDLPTTVPCKIAQEAFQDLIAPIFSSDQIVDQTLVELRPANVIETLNEQLRGWERDYPMKGCLRPDLDARPTKRHGIYLADDEHGLLVTDMTPQSTEEEVIEFKPKWLTQSPSAPENSKRCRQCARVARQNAERARNREKPAKTFCPLDLVSEDRRDLVNVARILLAPISDGQPVESEHKIIRFAKWLESNTLLKRLRNYQNLFDKVGPFNAPVEDKDFLRAMTLRDCTVFVRFPEDENAKIEARIGDLDLKSKDKKQYWHDTELALIEEGWYEGLENKEEYQPLNNCSLNKDRKGRRRYTE